MVNRVIMCPPAYYKIPSVQNVHMDVRNQPDPELAWSQWIAVRNIYELLGLRVFEMSPKPYLYDMVFTANGAWADGSRAVVANFLNPSRQPEAKEFDKILKLLGFKTFALPEGVFFEGQGEVAMVNGLVFGAHGVRSSVEAYDYVRSLLTLNKDIMPLRLISKTFYHLDTCMLSDPAREMFIYYPGAFSQESLRQIRILCGDNCLPITNELASYFVCNSVAVNNTLLLNIPFRNVPEAFFEMSSLNHHINEDDPRYRNLIKRNIYYKSLITFIWSKGYRIVPVYTSEFFKSGAGVRCISLFV